MPDEGPPQSGPGRVPQRGFRGREPGAPPDPDPFPDHTVLRSERIYDSPWCGLRRDILELEGQTEHEYHVFEIADAVVVVPVLEDGSILLIGQHRHPTGRTHWEAPAGRIADGETPEACALRELREETGYRAGRLVALPGFFPTNGISAHYAHVFVGLDCVREGDPQPDSTEQIVSRSFTRDEVEKLLAAGRIQDGFAAISLMYYLRLDPR